MEPTNAVFGTNTSLTLSFNKSETGYFVSWGHPLSASGINTDISYRNIQNRTWGNQDVIDFGQYNYAMPWMRNAINGVLIEPSDINYNSNGTQVILNSSSFNNLFSFNNHNLNGTNLQDQWVQSCYSASLGVNSTDNQTLYVAINTGSVYASFDGGAYWTLENNSVNLYQSPFVCVNEDIVSTLSSSIIPIRSLNEAQTFLSGAFSNIDQISFYGPLAKTPQSGTWKLFIYERPSDVIFETAYGAWDTGLSSTIDDYSTHYVLPYDCQITAGDTTSLTLTITGSFNRAFIGNEFAGDFIKLQNFNGITSASFPQYEIDRNTSAGVGQPITFWFRDELPIAPAVGTTLAQIVKRRPEGVNYYSVLTRDTDINAWVYANDDGSKFIPSQEQTWDWYGHDVARGGLPYEINTTDNQARADFILTDANRMRVAAGQSFNDAAYVVPQMLQNLAVGYRS